MYYEEKIINGVLCHRSVPDGKWVLFTSKQLSAILNEAKKQQGE